MSAPVQAMYVASKLADLEKQVTKAQAQVIEAHARVALLKAHAEQFHDLQVLTWSGGEYLTSNTAGAAALCTEVCYLSDREWDGTSAYLSFRTPSGVWASCRKRGDVFDPRLWIGNVCAGEWEAPTDGRPNCHGGVGIAFTVEELRQRITQVGLTPELVEQAIELAHSKSCCHSLKRSGEEGFIPYWLRVGHPRGRA